MDPQPARAIDTGTTVARNASRTMLWGAGAAVLVLAAITLLITMLGGFATVAPRPTPAAAVGEQVPLNAITITVTSARLAAESPTTGMTSETGERYLIVELEAVNTWHRAIPSSLFPGQSLRLQEDPNRDQDDIIRSDDGTRFANLQPGVPVPLLLSWTISDDDFTNQSELPLNVYEQSIRTGPLIGETWDDPVKVATMTVPLRDSTNPGAQ